MGLRWIFQTLARRWYLTTSGVLLSLVAAAALFSMVPPTYSSSGTLVLVQSKQPGPNSSNPLLTFDTSLSTTAALLVQQMDTTTVMSAIRTEPKSSFTVKNVGEVTTHDLSVQPFIYFTTQSPNREDSMEMVSRLGAIAQEQLDDRQNELKVRRSSRIRLESVVDPTAAKYVFGSQVAATGGALMSGVVATLLLVLGWERFVASRRRPVPVQEDHDLVERERIDSERLEKTVAAWLPGLVGPRETSLAVATNGVKSNGGSARRQDASAG